MFARARRLARSRVQASRSVWRAISCTMLILAAMVCIASTALFTAAPPRHPGGLAGDLLGLGRIVGVLLDVAGHFLNR
jgi:hypothetical protein